MEDYIKVLEENGVELFEWYTTIREGDSYGIYRYLDDRGVLPEVEFIWSDGTHERRPILDFDVWYEDDYVKEFNKPERLATDEEIELFTNHMESKYCILALKIRKGL